VGQSKAESGKDHFFGNGRQSVLVITLGATDSNHDRQMKRGILAATLMVTVAGVASANLLTDESRTARQAAPVARNAPSVAEAAAVPEAAPVTQERSRASQKVPVEARQAPVPLQVKRTTINAKLPTIDALIATPSAYTKNGEKDAEEAKAEPAAATDDGFSETKAKAAIEADGYKGVTVLRKGQNGVWHAKALRGKTEVMLTVDASGSVAAD
jgi:hypothetical protein